MAGEWVFACRLSELEGGEGARVRLSQHDKEYNIAVWRRESRVYALENRCCHKSASLHRGDIEDLGMCVVDKRGQQGLGGVCVRCPKHQRKFGGGLYFNLETGRARQPEFTPHFRDLRQHHVRAYDARCGNGNVYVSLLRKGGSSGLVKAHHRPTVEDVAPPLASGSSFGRPAGVARASSKRQREEEELRAALPLTLLEVTRVNHDTSIFVLAQPDESPLPPPPTSPVWHVSILASIDGELVEREYTPLSSWQEWSARRILRLLVKVYSDGVMTQHLAKLRLGSTVRVTAPIETLDACSLLPPAAKEASSPPAHLVLIAGGTGIMPMLQILEEALRGGSGPGVRSCVLVYSNRSPEDLLCWPEICRMWEAVRSKAGVALQVVAAFTGSPAPAPQDRAKILEQSGEAPPPPSSRVVCKRVDAAVLEEALRPLSRAAAQPGGGGRVQVIVSGPAGLFQAMRGAFPRGAFQQECRWVNLDE